MGFLKQTRYSFWIGFPALLGISALGFVFVFAAEPAKGKERETVAVGWCPWTSGPGHQLTVAVSLKKANQLSQWTP
jgi:hypothetical protein